MGESITKFVDRQKRRVARLGLEAEAAAHEAYGKAIRARQDLKLGSPGEVMRYGIQLLEEQARPPVRPPRRTVAVARPSSRPASAGVARSLREAALQADTAMRGAANAFTFGGADHLAAGMNALIEPGGLDGWRSRYETNLVQERARNDYDKGHRPVALASGQVGGALLGVRLIGPMEGALATAPRLRGAAALSHREGAAILAAGGGAGLGMQALTDGVTGRRSTSGDNLGAVFGGVAGAAALPLGPARAGAIGASTTSAAQDIFNRRPIAMDQAAESAIVGSALGGVAGVAGRAWADKLPRDAKGPIGEALGEMRSTINGLRRPWGPKWRDEIYDGQKKPYWYPDGRSGSLRFEDKFGVHARLSPNQILAQQIGGDNFQLYHFLPADFGKAAAVPAAGAALHVTPSRRRR